MEVQVESEDNYEKIRTDAKTEGISLFDGISPVPYQRSLGGRACLGGSEGVIENWRVIEKRCFRCEQTKSNRSFTFVGFYLQGVLVFSWGVEAGKQKVRPKEVLKKKKKEGKKTKTSRKKNTSTRER